MSTPWHDVLADVAIRVNALTGSLAADIRTSYTTRPLTSTQFKSAVFPFEAVKAACQRAEQRLAGAIADTGNHPWRNVLAGVTASLAHKAQLPSVDSGSTQIIGVWGSVYDASDGTACKELSLEEIERIVRNANARLKCAYYNYKLDGQRIYHTRAGVKLDCCVYNAATQKTAIDNNSNMLLPDVLAPAIMCEALALLFRDSQFEAQAAQFAEYAGLAEQGIRQGLTSVPAKAIPNPTMTATAN